MREPSALGDVRPQCDSGESAQRLRDERRVIQLTGKLERLPEERPGSIVIAHPERHEPGVEVCAPPEAVVAHAGFQDLGEGSIALLEPALDDPQPIRRVRQPKRIVLATGIQEPRDRLADVARPRIEPLDGLAGSGAGHLRRELLGQVQERDGRRRVHPMNLRSAW